MAGLLQGKWGKAAVEVLMFITQASCCVGYLYFMAN